MATDVVALRRADLDLAGRSVRGDELAHGAIFDAHRRRVHRVVYRILGSNRDAEDTIQEVFLEVFRSLPSYRGEAQLGTWIDRIAVRVALHALASHRARGAALELVVSDGIDPATPPDRRAQMREAARHLYAMLDAVTPANRAAFILHVVDGRSLAEVADLMGASRIATRLRVWRTRQRLEAAARRDPLLAPFVENASSDEGWR